VGTSKRSEVCERIFTKKFARENRQLKIGQLVVLRLALKYALKDLSLEELTNNKRLICPN